MPEQQPREKLAHDRRLAEALHHFAEQAARFFPSAEVIELLEKRVKTALADVSTAEQVKRFAVLPRPFTLDADEITVSLKLRRGVVLKHYADRLTELYRD